MSLPNSRDSWYCIIVFHSIQFSCWGWQKLSHIKNCLKIVLISNTTFGTHLSLCWAYPPSYRTLNLFEDKVWPCFPNTSRVSDPKDDWHVLKELRYRASIIALYYFSSDLGIMAKYMEIFNVATGNCLLHPKCVHSFFSPCSLSQDIWNFSGWKYPCPPVIMELGIIRCQESYLQNLYFGMFINFHKSSFNLCPLGNFPPC